MAIGVFGKQAGYKNDAHKAAVEKFVQAQQRRIDNFQAQVSAGQQRQAPSYTPGPGQQMQMKMQMLMVMMAMMQAMAQLSGGFSNFLGGPSQPQYPTPYAR